jgi:hypothetical protein
VHKLRYQVDRQQDVDHRRDHAEQRALPSYRPFSLARIILGSACSRAPSGGPTRDARSADHGAANPALRPGPAMPPLLRPVA